MATLDQESLFSLEVVVDILTLQKKIGCRFPAVAFRLLDFPTLLIYHVEPELGENIRTKIQTDSTYTAPKQLPELQDRNGNYAIKKGKSCLFKVSPNTLQSHLQSTPLYVMVIDTYPDTPKLVASCTVPLDTCMDDIYEDICKLGISVPSAHGERGDYQLCNLMGRDAGSMVLGVRLLSLGVGLLPHIPEKSVAKLQKKSVLKSEDCSLVRDQNKHGNSDEPEPIALYDLDTAEKPVQVSIAPSKVDVENFQSQTEKEILQTVATQTKNARSSKKLKKIPNEQLAFDNSSAAREEIDDFFVTNSVRPPPLLFNSETDTKTAEGLVFSHYPLGLPSQQHEQEHYSYDSDEDTIRSEDTFSDTGIASDRLFKPQSKEFQIQKSSQHPQVPKKATAAQRPDNFSNLPILNALLHEIAALRMGEPPPVGDHGEIAKKMLPMSTPRTPRSVRTTDVTPRDTSRPTTPGRREFAFPKETKDDFLTRLSSPRRVPPGMQEPRSISPPGTHRHVGMVSQAGQHEVKEPPKTINKGWIRQQPAVGVKKTKLSYGMTNTQRLRLAKGNPELLRSLEKEEEERLQKRRQNMLKKWGSTGLFTGMADISTEIGRHPLGNTANQSQRPDIPPLDLDDSIDLRHHHKRPVPTPRHSITAKDIHEELKRERFDDDESHHVPPITPRKSKQARERGCHDVMPERDNDHRKHVDQETSSHSEAPSSRIEIRLPSATMFDDGASDATSLNDSDLVESVTKPERMLGQTKILHSPGFPLTDSVDSQLLPYSEDFESQTTGAEPGLKKVTDQYSDGEDDPKVNTGTLEGVSAADELGLRCIVDKYSDESSSRKSDSQNSYYSVKSNNSNRSQDRKNKIQMPSLPNPSNKSPDTFSISKPLTAATRQPFTAVSINDPLSGTQDSTAYIRQSQVVSQMSTESIRTVAESSESPRRGVSRPQPSPRGVRSSQSMHTESVSSYVPSDAENISPLSPGGNGGEYSDNFEYSDDEDHEDYTISSEILQKPKSVKDMTVAPEAKFGYTWGY